MITKIDVWNWLFIMPFRISQQALLHGDRPTRRSANKPKIRLP